MRCHPDYERDWWEFQRSWRRCMRQFESWARKQQPPEPVPARDPVRPVLKATHGGSGRHFTIAGEAVPCFVLEDGTRVISQRGMLRAVGLAPNSSERKRRKGSVTFSPDFPTPNNVQAYFSGESSAHEVGDVLVRFETPDDAGNHLATGYPATFLIDFCEAVLKARQEGALRKNQQKLAQRCETIVRAVARVGIIALVDEATGYQETRERRALNQILERYVAKELLPWSKRFPDEFYAQLFRLHNWPIQQPGRRPRRLAQLTAELIYEKLPPGVLEHLRRVNPITENGDRAYKHHQWLTPGCGNPHLDKQIAIVTSLMRASTTWPEFVGLFERACGPS